jgi:hypothetical protein
VPELADIVRRHGPAYRRQFGTRMSADQLRALRDIAVCRTPVLGGQLWRCPTCGQERLAFHSCGNRHCPACGADDAHAWRDRQHSLLLPVPYHLATFTVPDTLRRTIRSHPRELLALLFRTASTTLLDLCANPRWLGATPGVTAVLHTWTRQLEYHPHVHFLVTGGGLAPDGSWRESDPGFLVPVHALSQVFRARFRDELKPRFPDLFAGLPAKTWTTPWVVHAEHVGSGEQALRYLSRYLYRVAISNAALLRADDQTVTFRYRDSQNQRSRTCTLAPHEFLRRFLQHVLPKGFVKARTLGLHHPAKRRALTLVRLMLYWQARRQPPPATSLAPPATQKVTCCPHCAAPMRRVQLLAPLSTFTPCARGPPP